MAAEPSRGEYGTSGRHRNPIGPIATIDVPYSPIRMAGAAGLTTANLATELRLHGLLDSRVRGDDLILG